MPRKLEDRTKEEWSAKAEEHRQMLIFVLNLLQNHAYTIDAVKKLIWRHLMRNNPHYSSMSMEFNMLDMENWLGKINVKIEDISP